MSMRVTRQVVEVLADGGGTAGMNVSRQVIEVLAVPGFEIELTDTLVLEDEVLNDPRMAVTQQMVEVLADGGGTAGVRVTQQMVEILGDDAPTSIIYEVELEDILELEDEGRAPHTVEPSVESILSLISTATGHLSVRNISITDELALEDIVHRIVEVDLEDTLALVDEGFRLFTFSDTLDLQQTLTPTLQKTITEFLALADSVARQMIRNRSFTDTLELQQAVLIVRLSSGILCRYLPQIGTGRTIAGGVPNLVHQNETMLFHPFITPTSTVALPNPEFGNRIAFTPNRISRKSRGGTKLVYRKSTWPVFTTLKMDFSHLTSDQKDDFVAFLQASLGKDIGLIDHEGRQWKGIITTPDSEITGLGERGCGNYATSFEFEGVISP